MNTEQQLKSIDDQLARLSKESERLNDRRKTIVQRQQDEQIKQAGIAVGGSYKAIPIEQGGDVKIGVVRKLDTNHWRGGVVVKMLLPANARKSERVVFVDLDKHEFEKVSLPKNGNKRTK